MSTDQILQHLGNNNVTFTLDTSPSKEKVSRIQKAIERKKDLMDIAISAYKSLVGAI